MSVYHSGLGKFQNAEALGIRSSKEQSDRAFNPTHGHEIGLAADGWALAGARLLRQFFDDWLVVHGDNVSDSSGVDPPIIERPNRRLARYPNYTQRRFAPLGGRFPLEWLAGLPGIRISMPASIIRDVLVLARSKFDCREVSELKIMTRVRI